MRNLRAGQGPVSTYRLQLRPGFGFAEAARTADYLAALGVSHVYLSPILQAAPGSMHGYDVVDHSRISSDLGGDAAFRAMVGQFRAHGLGVIVDIVPNHMAIPVPELLNRQLWSVLREGPGSPYAHWFDIDWSAHEGRLLLPILAGPVEDCIGDMTVDRLAAGDADGGECPGAHEAVVRYFGHVLPVRSGTAGLPLEDLVHAQHYRLAHWRAAAAELNWRRFFDITTLIGIRAEDAGVFGATHRLLISLVAEGFIDGLRVDHPDGLTDPRGYLRRLSDASGGMWVIAEKILTGPEELPRDWLCAGTTGYDTLHMAGGLFVDPDGRAPLTRAYVDFTQVTNGFAGVARAAKRDTASRGLAAEISRLTRLAADAGRPELSRFSGHDVRAVLVEMLAAFPVYRAYVVPGEPAPAASVMIVDGAAAAARRRLPGRLGPAVDVMCDLVLGRGAGATAGSRGAEFIVRFQQTCGPVMAKGVEDTAFYRWSRLTALNEVGGDPDRLGVSTAEFHHAAGRLARDWPATLSTLSTHDTKRQEDVRARLAVLAESPREWAREVARWHDRAAHLSGGQTPEPDTEYLMWQTLVGAWPIGSERLAGYLVKAMREAKTKTSWADTNSGYEAAVLAVARAVVHDPGLNASIAGFVARIAPDARVNSLGAKLVQLTMPGVADVYQGCDLAGFSLVDPDNRRMVDFARRRRMLTALDAAAAFTAARPAPPAGTSHAAGLDADKLLVTSRSLRLRRDHPGWFAGSYAPLQATGPAAQHVVVFLRGGNAVTVATRLPAGLRRRGGWADTALALPGTRWRDVLTGATHDGTRLLLTALMRRLPVAVLIPERTPEP